MDAGQQTEQLDNAIDRVNIDVEHPTYGVFPTLCFIEARPSC